MRIFKDDPDNKVQKLLEFAGRCDDVSDPWYSRRFDVAYSDIYEGCRGLLGYCLNFLSIDNIIKP